MKYFFDSHSHSNNSFDAEDSVEDICKAAIATGIEKLAITDHCDLGPQSLEECLEVLTSVKAQVEVCKEKFAGQLQLNLGVEIGQAIHDSQSTTQLLQVEGLDVVLGSLHNIHSTEDFYYLQNKDIDRKSLLTRYYNELFQTVKDNRFDILSHITYPYRYLGYDTTLPITYFEEVLRETFTLLAKNDKALEVNTSGLFRTPRGRTMPDLWEVKLFKECGGKLVSIGSDSHTAGNIGKGVLEGQHLLLEAGFKEQVFFTNRKPELSPLAIL